MDIKAISLYPTAIDSNVINLKSGQAKAGDLRDVHGVLECSSPCIVVNNPTTCLQSAMYPIGFWQIDGVETALLVFGLVMSKIL